MTRIKVKQLIWNEWNSVHIKKHNVSVSEIESAVKQLIGHKKGHTGRYILIGRSSKRLISTVVRRIKANTYYVVTARDADKKERKIVYEIEKKQNS